MCLDADFAHVVVPFDRILDAAADGEYEGQKVDAGLVIHEGQLTYADQDLNLVIDTGQWWFDQTGLPLPLGANAIRKDLGPTSHRRGQSPPQGEYPIRPRPSRGKPSTTPSLTGADWIAAKPTSS